MFDFKGLLGKKQQGGTPADASFSFMQVGQVADVPPGAGKVFTVMGREIWVFNIDGVFHAINNICPHQYRPIGTAEFQGKMLTCLWHSFEFDVETGACAVAPQFQLTKFPVRVEGENILVALREAD
jgi:nitrite reductase/ring-hydroxylating ferredoxin subunit